MKHAEFAYWLQGAFEILEPEYLTAKQAGIIIAHLNLVRKIEGSNNDFEMELRGMLEAAIMAMNEVTTPVLDAIKEKLNGLFRHEIDPSYEGDPQELQAIHDGLKPDRPDFLKPVPLSELNPGDLIELGLEPDETDLSYSVDDDGEILRC